MARPRPVLPEPLWRLARLLGLPVGAVARYWAAEARPIRQATVALALGLAATLVAGVVLGAARGPLAEYPGLLVLIPAAIGMRGAIFGALAARLSTGMLTGEFVPELVRDSFLGRQVEAATLLTVASSAEAGALAWAISVLLGLPVIPLLDLVTVSLVGGLLSSVVLVAVTVVMARRADARGWSMDDVGAPTITATGDLVTLPALLAATLLLAVEPLALALGAIGLAFGVAALVQGWRHDDPAIRRVVRESVVVLTIAVSMAVVAGIVLESRAERFLSVPALLVLVPPFIANCGSLGSILASRLASKLHVGLIEPRAVPGRLAGLDFSLVTLLALVAFSGVGAVGWLASWLVGLTPPSPVVMIGTTLTAGVLATAILVAVAYTAATASFRFGFDPDNHGIPIVTAAMDLFGILSLVAAMTLLQVT